MPLGGCATKLSPGVCAAIGAGAGAVGGGIGGGFYSANNEHRRHDEWEGAGIAAGSTLVGAGVGYLVCKLIEEPEAEPVRRAAPTPAPAPAPKPAPPPKPTACTGKMRLQGVTFGNDSAAISSNAAVALDQTVAELKGCPEQRVRLGAHTDSSGSESYNQALSQRRADSVRAYLVQRGIVPGRIEAKGFGEANPVASNATREGRAQNRRVEIAPIN